MSRGSRGTKPGEFNTPHKHRGRRLGTIGGPGRLLKQFGWVHEIACPGENSLLVAELLNWRVQKLLLRP